MYTAGAYHLPLALHVHKIFHEVPYDELSWEMMQPP